MAMGSLWQGCATLQCSGCPGEEQLFPTSLPINSWGSGRCLLPVDTLFLARQSWHFPPHCLQPGSARQPGAVPFCPPWTTAPPPAAPGTSILCCAPLQALPWPSTPTPQHPSHRHVGLDEPVLQVTGLLPVAPTAQAVQLAQRGPQDVGEGTDTPRGTWRQRGTLAASSARCVQPAPPRHHCLSSASPCPAASVPQRSTGPHRDCNTYPGRSLPARSRPIPPAPGNPPAVSCGPSAPCG